VNDPRTRVLLAGDIFSFPHGTGSTTRVLAFARGLQHAGADVLVVPTSYSNHRPTEALNPHATGAFEGVPFKYAAGTATRPDNFVRRRVAQVRGMTGAATPFLMWDGRPPDSVILFTGHSYVLPMTARLATALRGAALLFDGCEQPFVYEQESARRRLEERAYTPVGYRIYDGVIAISEHLQRYFAARTGAGTRIIRVPILVDPERFAGLRAPADVRYVGYSGELSESKGVHDLIRAFACVADDFPDVVLRISGSPNPAAYIDRLLVLARELGIAPRVEFLGTVPYSEFPGLLQGAEVLVVPHPSGTFSDAAFPTKLGEYLSSGTPTITTRVGEVDRYVRDGEDVYLVPPNDHAALAAALRRVLGDPSTAAAVGVRGRATAERCFDYRLHGRRLLDFIGDLDRRRRASSTPAETGDTCAG
jgi:glycosyltransferase involved in cell wall biosynthesis